MIRRKNFISQAFATVASATTTVSSVTVQRPRRSLLFVPGNDERKVAKASTLDADCIALDCEDGVAQNRKEAARTHIMSTLGNISFGRSEFAVRVNSPDSGIAGDDLDAFLSGKVLPDCILVPKMETPDQVKWLGAEMDKHLKKRKNFFRRVPVLLQIETAIGLLNMRSIFEEAVLDKHPFHIQGGIVGTDDFLASIGGTRTKDAKELLFARQFVVTHCKAFGLQAIDMVHIDFKDLEGLRRHSEEGACMGFTGKQIIHPGQIDTVNKAFLPSQEKVDWAEGLIRAFDEHQASGKGAFTFRGSMIDMPLLKQAKNIIHIMQQIKGN